MKVEIFKFNTGIVGYCALLIIYIHVLMCTVIALYGFSPDVARTLLPSMLDVMVILPTVAMCPILLWLIDLIISMSRWLYKKYRRVKKDD